jgi:hypothetical protein
MTPRRQEQALWDGLTVVNTRPAYSPDELLTQLGINDQEVDSADGTATLPVRDIVRWAWFQGLWQARKADERRCASECPIHFRENL